MPKENIEKCHDNFEQAIEDHRSLVKEITSSGSPIKGKVREYLVEMIVIRMASDLDNFFFELLVVCLHNDLSRIGDSNKRLPWNMESCEAIILERRPYLRYKDAEELIEISEKFLPDESNPFLKIDGYRHLLSELTNIRNYCAHRSKFSQQNLLKLYQSGQHQCKDWIEPESFLLENKGKRLLEYIDTLKKLSYSMQARYGREL